MRWQDLSQLQFSMPPLEEQRRIVAAVNAAMDEVREARARVDAVPAKVKALKASILDAAFRGELTADWRAQHPISPQALAPAPSPPRDDRDPGEESAPQPSPTPGLEGLPSPEFDDDAEPMEPASVLLQRILAERRARWEQAQRAKHAPKPQPLNSKPQTLNYKDPALPDVTALADLPETWGWGSLDALSSQITSGSRAWSKYYVLAGGDAFVMAQNVRPLNYNFGHRQGVAPPVDSPDRLRAKVNPGDLLITIVGNAGDSCVFPGDDSDHYVCQSVALVRPLINSGYLAMALNSPAHVWEKWNDWIYGEGRPHLSFNHLRMTPIALAPLPEQREIVRRVEAAFKEADALAAAAEATRAALKRLEQSILAAAFSGEI